MNKKVDINDKKYQIILSLCHKKEQIKKSYNTTCAQYKCVIDKLDAKIKVLTDLLKKCNSKYNPTQ